MMPIKTSVGPNEVVRLEVLRLAPPFVLELKCQGWGWGCGWGQGRLRL
jgi:hypothetical protein